MNIIAHSAKRVIGIFAIAAFIICFPLVVQNAYAAEEIASGTCGENLTWILYEDGVFEISGNGDMDTDIYVPWSHLGERIKRVVIAQGVTSIKNLAFIGCANLTSITIPNSVTSIGNYAFDGCNSLTNITIPNSVASIGIFAFHGCNSLTSITLPDSLTSIGSNAFSGCCFTSITIPDSVTRIDEWAFSGCSSLTSITIPDGVTSIANWAFSGCSSLTSVTLPDSLTSIGSNAFSGCCFTSITIPDSVTCIGSQAFSGCSNLTNITIPGSMTSIGQSAFSGSCLTSITIPDHVTSIGDYAFNECRDLASVTIPDSVTSIGDFAFWSCDSLTAITIPDSVTSIGMYAFPYTVVITCGQDSFGHTYAVENNYKYDLSTGHQIDSGSVSKQATCVSEGLFAYRCTTCGAIIREESLPKTDHQWNTTYTVDVPATESATGSQSIHCSVCGAVKDGSAQTIAKLPSSEIADLPAVKIAKPAPAKKKITVKWKKAGKKDLKKISGIQIQVATDPGFTNIVKTATASKKKTSKTIKGLQPKTKYYVRIRAYAAGNHVSNWKSKSVKVK